MAQWPNEHKQIHKHKISQYFIEVHYEIDHHTQDVIDICNIVTKHSLCPASLKIDRSLLNVRFFYLSIFLKHQK